jgi:hypothetical protein
MINSRGRTLLSILILSIYLISPELLSGQTKRDNRIPLFPNFISLKPDTTAKNGLEKNKAENPDTNFTFEKYRNFLKAVSDTGKYIVVPINEFRRTYNSNKIVIGLRHDVDNDLNVAYQFSETESAIGVRSTYYILHTAPYYLADPSNKLVHSNNILPLLKSMQNERHFEIGWHNDLVTLQVVYAIDPVSFLHNELSWLRSNGLNIEGTASHGSNYCHTYLYLNYYFFEECTYPAVGEYVNNITVPVGSNSVKLKKGKLSDFGLAYEAYFLDNNKYFSDASIINGLRWNIEMLDIADLKKGDRVIILLHPIHWHKASVNAEIESFSIAGQRTSFTDIKKSVITVELPGYIDKKSLVASFSLSPGAYAKVSGKLQRSGTGVNDFSSGLVYTVYAENRDVKKEWKIEIQQPLLSDLNYDNSKPILRIYPNPSSGIVNMKFINIMSAPVKVTVYNSLGMAVYSNSFNRTGNFIFEKDFSNQPDGIYYIRYSGSEKSVPFVIQKSR